MKFASYILISLLTLVLFAGCATIKGNNIVEQKGYVHDMKAETLVRLYGEYPIAKEQIKNSAGYGVFSNINTHILFLSGGNGYGVVTDNQDNNPVYMKMGTLGGGVRGGVELYI